MLSAAVSLLLRLLGRDPDPAKSREHVLLSVLAERRLVAGQPAALAALLDDLAQPPIEQIGALELSEFLPKTERRALAAALNTLLASPTFASWRQGATLDIAAWLTPKAALPEYGSHDAIVFNGVDYFQIWLNLMLGRWSYLADKFVQLDGAPVRSREEVIAFLKSRVQPVGPVAQRA